MSLIYLLLHDKANKVIERCVDGEESVKKQLEKIAQLVANVGVDKWKDFINCIYDDIMESDRVIMSWKLRVMWLKYLNEGSGD